MPLGLGDVAKGPRTSCLVWAIGFAHSSPLQATDGSVEVEEEEEPCGEEWQEIPSVD